MYLKDIKEEYSICLNSHHYSIRMQCFLLLDGKFYLVYNFWQTVLLTQPANWIATQIYFHLPCLTQNSDLHYSIIHPQKLIMYSCLVWDLHANSILPTQTQKYPQGGPEIPQPLTLFYLLVFILYVLNMINKKAMHILCQYRWISS